MGDGSRWYFPVYEGLFAAEHCEKMGQALWLYGWLVARAHVAQQGGVVQYNHLTAANDLGKSERTIRMWFQTLQQNGYIETRARHTHHLEVQVTKWRAVEEWLESRRGTDDGQLLAGLGKPEPESGSVNGRVTGNETGKILPPPLLSITLEHYEYPSGSPREPGRCSLADAFHEYQERLKDADGNRRVAALRAIYIICYGDKDVPDYGYLGRAAKAVGGAGRLAQMMWESTARPPTGDVLAYFMGRAKREAARRNGQARQADDDGTPRGAAAIDAWLASKEVHGGN